jgi:hypothetical protein
MAVGVVEATEVEVEDEEAGVEMEVIAGVVAEGIIVTTQEEITEDMISMILVVAVVQEMIGMMVAVVADRVVMDILRTGDRLCHLRAWLLLLLHPRF